MGILQFLPDFQQKLQGELKVGGRLTIDYAADRVPCRRERLGIQIGHLTPFIRFQPGGQSYHGSGTQFSLPIPGDATEAEVWFYSWNAMACSAWDSRFGENYHYPVTGPARVLENVAYRSGSIPSLEMVNAVEETPSKVKHSFGSLGLGGSELQTRLAVKAWINNISFHKNVWMDLHVFDGNDTRVHAETFTLQYLEPAGAGEFFKFDDMVYQGSGGGPGSAWNRPDARTVQYRLYYQVNEQVFTDGILHNFEVEADDLVWNAPAGSARP